MISKVFLSAMVVAVAVAVASADGYGHGGGHGGGHGKGHHHKPAYYKFKYGVEDAYKGLKFGHKESRDGYNTKGAYYVHLPDGRTQKVSYTADKHGYNAHVSYDGYAHHDKGHKHSHGHGGYH